MIPKSEFVKNKIKGTKLTPRSERYIRQLITIERCVTGDIRGLWTGYIRKDLEEKYPHEFEAISMELRPDLWKKHKEEQKQFDELLDTEWKKHIAQTKKEDEKFKNMWKNLGGNM